MISRNAPASAGILWKSLESELLDTPLTSHIMSYYNNLILGALTCLLALIISVSALSMLFHSKFDPRGKVRPNSPTSAQRMIWGSSAT